MTKDYIDGIYMGIKLANSLIKPYGLKVNVPSKKEILRMCQKEKGGGQ